MPIILKSFVNSKTTTDILPESFDNNLVMDHEIYYDNRATRRDGQMLFVAKTVPRESEGDKNFHRGSWKSVKKLVHSRKFVQ